MDKFVVANAAKPLIFYMLSIINDLKRAILRFSTFIST